MVAEMQFLFVPKEAKKAESESEYEHVLKEANHFFYELERNPLGIIVHCVEMILSIDDSAAEKWKGYWIQNNHRGDM